MNLSERTQKAMTFTEEVTTKWSSRLVGSAACQACAQFLHNTMASFCDHTATQEFDVRPGAFLGYIRVNVVLYLMGLVALWMGYVVVAVGAAVLAIAILIFQFLFYKEFIDFLFPKKKGINVTGAIEPSGDVQQQVIISAHHDSAHIFNFLAKDPDKYGRKVLGGILALFLMALFSTILLIIQIGGWEIPVLQYSLLGILSVLAIPTFRMWFFYAKEGTPGAGDNLICVALLIEIGKYFAEQKKNGNPLKHTRIILGSWDAEEAGLRGARAYVTKNKSELQKVKTYNFNLECMYDHASMSFLTSDLNSFVPLSTNMAEKCVEVASSLDYNIKTQTFPLLAGGTDAAEFAKAGIEATTLAAMSWTKRTENPTYHTLNDTIDAVDTEAVSRSIEIGINYILKKDNELHSL